MSLIVENAPLFVAGLWATLRIAVVTLIASTLIGFAIGTMATARTTWLIAERVAGSRKDS